MGQVVKLPGHRPGEVFFDAARPDHSLKVTWRTERGIAVLSLWKGDTCTGTLRLAVEDVPALVNALVAGLAVPHIEAAQTS